VVMQKNYPDETWSMNQLVSTLCNRRYTEKTVAYAQSHDQSIVGVRRILPNHFPAASWLLPAIWCSSCVQEHLEADAL
jgi:1,4-alpha-glucan branching enzyme